jgi:hypothetical protein
MIYLIGSLDTRKNDKTPAALTFARAAVPVIGERAVEVQLDGNAHVIVGAKPGAALCNLETPCRTIRRQAGLNQVRLHDLRHAFGSIAASSGIPIIGKMLGDSQPAETAHYAHLASDPVKSGRGCGRQQDWAAAPATSRGPQARCCRCARGALRPEKRWFGKAGAQPPNGSSGPHSRPP